jgi:alpha-ribazole phosphatase
MTIVLCRHGATDANAGGAILSRSDPPLNRAGREQSERTYGALHGIAFDRAFCSPMRRCIETLEIVAPRLAYRCDERLREVDFGAWEGRTLEWLETNDAAGLAHRRRDPVHFRPPQGESFADKSVHLRPFAEDLRLVAAANVLVVAHRGTLGVLERVLRDLPLESQAVTPLEPGEFHILKL